jgi:hypothetical protein
VAVAGLRRSGYNRQLSESEVLRRSTGLRVDLIFPVSAAGDLANDSANGMGGAGRDRWSGWNVWDGRQALFTGLNASVATLGTSLGHLITQRSQVQILPPLQL